MRGGIQKVPRNIIYTQGCSPSPHPTQGNTMKKIKTLFFTLSSILIVMVLYSCASTVVKDGTIYTVGHTASENRRFKIGLKVYTDPETDYSLFRRFRSEFRATDSANPLFDKHLKLLIEKSMLERGFVKDDESPDFIVMGLHQNIYVPDRDPGIRMESGRVFGSSGGQSFSGTYHSGDGLVTALIKAKRAQRYWIHEFGMTFFDPRTNQAIWIGTAEAYVRVDDLRETAPDIIKAIVSNCPEPKQEVTEKYRERLKRYELTETKKEVKSPELQEEKKLREITFADGSKYIGNIVNGRMHGQGTYIWTSGDKYIGEFADNKATGGWFYRVNGTKLWVSQDPEGKWIISNNGRTP